MKKLWILATVISLFAVQAHAAPLVNGPYIALRAGGDNMHFKSDGETKRNTVFAFLMAVGARLKAFRGEFEWANLTRAKIKDTKTRFEQQRYMAQFYYEIPLRSAIRPYLNAGLGASYTEVNYRDGNNRKKTDDDTTFAWNGGAGITVNWTRMWSFDLGYRYVDTGKAKFDNGKVRNQNHEIYLGCRLTF